jgi:hypothetical protein
MRYQPVNRPDRGHVGKNWNSYHLRSMQVILQATHGIVSGAPEFFRKAFGDTYEEFENILLRPHHYIFNRYWYEQYDGRPEFEEFQAAMKALSEDERTELLGYLCTRDKNDYASDLNELGRRKLRDAARFFVPMSKADEARIWEAQKRRRVEDINAYLVPEDERVEDAGLTDEDVQPASKVKKQLKRCHASLRVKIEKGGKVYDRSGTDGSRMVSDEPRSFVGKDVLELLAAPCTSIRCRSSVSMSKTPLMPLMMRWPPAYWPSIEDGLIEINLDHIDRRVVIRDNGRGLANTDFAKRMLSFGASEKRGTDARGFRGVGRLSAWLRAAAGFSLARQGRHEGAGSHVGWARGQAHAGLKR